MQTNLFYKYTCLKKVENGLPDPDVMVVNTQYSVCKPLQLQTAFQLVSW